MALPHVRRENRAESVSTRWFDTPKDWNRPTRRKYFHPPITPWYQPGRAPSYLGFRGAPSRHARIIHSFSPFIPRPVAGYPHFVHKFINRAALQTFQQPLPSRFVSLTSADDNAEVRISMRTPCSRCGCTEGLITTKSGQDTVRCSGCRRYCYNAPRSETGRPTRSLRTRSDVRPSQRARILVRDGGACILCHRSGVELEIGHLISVHDGRALGMSDAELNSDDNLAAMCAPCNSGLSSSSLPPRLLAAAMWARSRRANPDIGESDSA